MLVDESVRLWTPPEDLGILPPRPFSLPRPTTDAELATAIEHYLGVRLPDTVVVPGHSTPFRAVADAFFGRHPVAVWYGARALAGKTMALAVLGWCEAVLLQADVSILGGSQDQSLQCQEYIQGFWRSPTVPTAQILDGAEPGIITTRLRWHNKIKALAASQTKARGGHPPRLRIDEADELDWDIYQAVAGQPMDQAGVRSQMVICSTMQNPDGTMHRVLQEAALKGWPIYTWGHQETLEPHGWLTQEQVARKRAQMTAESWRVEVELGEPNSEGLAIVREKVEATFRGALVVDQEGQLYELEPPVVGATYATGADWAKTQHYTAIATLRVDCTPMRLVAYERRRRRPMPEMVKRLDERLTYYPGHACHDHTGGGSYLADWIEHDVEDVDMVGRTRKDLFVNYIAGLERDEVRSGRIQSLYHDHKFVTTEALYLPSGHPPDGVVAMAMAYKAAMRTRVPLMVGGDAPAPVPGADVRSQFQGLLRRLGPETGNGHGGNGTGDGA